MPFFILIAIFALCAASPAAAQEQPSPKFKDSIPKEIIEQDNTFVTFTTENDNYSSNKDENYTNGLRLTYFDTSVKTPDFIERFQKILPFFEINNTTATYYSIGQNLYTPRDISTKIPNQNDRPYAGFLYGAVGVTTLSDNHIDDLELTLGLVGPGALGEQSQKIVHDIFDLQDPKGWDHQLKNEPIFNVGYQRRWPGFASTQLPMDLHLRATPHIGGAIGNAYTYGSVGGTLHLLPNKHKWQSTPPRVRPAIPGNGYFYIPDNEISWSGFVGAEGRAIAHNIFLDGNTFENSPSVDKNIGVLDLNAGVTLSYGQSQISYTLNWRSKEFDDQNNDSVFGAISIGYRF
jgi:lipid A 3-O-deacylase